MRLIHTEKIISSWQHAPRLVGETALRGLLGTALAAAVLNWSDISRLWARKAGVISSAFGPGDFEYPPLSALYWAPLSLLPSARWAVVVNGIVMTLMAMAITSLLVRAAHAGYSPDVRVWVASSALTFFLPIGWDVGVAFLVLAGVLALGTRSYVWAGMMLGVGAAFKIFPAAAFLPLLPLLPYSKIRRRFVWSGLGVATVAYVIYFFAWPQTWLLHIKFAAIRSYTRTIWWPVDTGLREAGVQLSNEAIGLAAAAALLMSLVGLTWWVSRRRPPVGEVALLSILSFILLNKVFNPQYLLWVLPLMALVRVPRWLAELLVYVALIQLVHLYLPIPDEFATAAFIVRTVALLGVGVIVVARWTAVSPAKDSHKTPAA